MLIELFATDNYGRYNIKVAEMFGLETAVYLDEILNIYEKAERKQKSSNGFFVVDRDYIFRRTTLKEETQIKIEDGLINVGIIKRTEPCTIFIDLPFFANIIADATEDIHFGIEKLLALKKKGKARTKKEVQADNAKKEIHSGDKGLDELLEQWVDAIVLKQGWINKITVREGQSKLLSFAIPDLEKAKEVAKLAAINAYRDMQWAIDRYKEQHPAEKILTNFNQNVNISTEMKF